MIFASLSKCFSSCLATWWAAHINQWLVQCEQLCGVILWWYDVMHRHCIGSCCLVGMTVVSFLFMHPEFCSLPQPHVHAPMIWQPSQGQEVCCLEQELLDAEGVTEYIYILFFFFCRVVHCLQLSGVVNLSISSCLCKLQRNLTMFFFFFFLTVHMYPDTAAQYPTNFA